MAKKKPSALEALAKLNDERLALEARTAELKRAAAFELGMVVLDAGGADLGPARLRDLIARVVAFGPDAALQLLSAKSQTTPVAAKSKTVSGAPETANG